MKVLVCTSNVHDTTAKITFTDNNAQFNTNGVQSITKPYHTTAITCNLNIKQVAQTGVVLSPNLYIAIKISKEIQHIAGIDVSKRKAADYGIVNDAFEAVPKVITSVKQYKTLA